MNIKNPTDKEITGCMYKGASSVSKLEPTWIYSNHKEIMAGVRCVLDMLSVKPVPEPEELTDEKLLELAAKALGYKSIAFYETRLMAEAGELLAYARAVLAADRARAALDRPAAEKPTDEVQP